MSFATFAKRTSPLPHSLRPAPKTSKVITDISDLSEGDMVKYYSKWRGYWRYAIITSIVGQRIWGRFANSLEEARKVTYDPTNILFQEADGIKKVAA